MEYDFRRRRESALSVRRLWRRWRSTSADAGVLRCRLSLFVVAIAALALVASGNPFVNGVAILSLTDDGAVLATVTGGGSVMDNEVYGIYISRDGGMSWSLYDGLAPDLYQSQSVDTPRGEYFIDEMGVSRLGADGRRELVYSTAYLRGDANEWLQEHDTQKKMGYRVLAKRPSDILYHADSGSVIAAMGIQGVAVETPNGRWHKVAVEAYSPTDFSFSAKMRALIESAWLIGAIGLALSLSALAVSAAVSEYGGHNLIGAFLLLAALGLLGIAGLLTGYPLLIVLASAPVSLAAIIAAVISAGGSRWKFALLACVSTLSPSIMLLLSIGLSNNVCHVCLDADIYRLAFTVASFLSLIPPLAYHARFIARRWRPFALAFAGMNALIALAFVLWIQMNVSLVAAQTAIVGLVGLAAVILVRHVRAGRRADPGGTRRAPMV